MCDVLSGGLSHSHALDMSISNASHLLIQFVFITPALWFCLISLSSWAAGILISHLSYLGRDGAQPGCIVMSQRPMLRRCCCTRTGSVVQRRALALRGSACQSSAPRECLQYSTVVPLATGTPRVPYAPQNNRSTIMIVVAHRIGSIRHGTVRYGTQYSRASDVSPA